MPLSAAACLVVVASPCAVVLATMPPLLSAMVNAAAGTAYWCSPRW
jgi:hypothetical protein